MNHREELFRFLDGQRVSRTPHFPDLSKWYEFRRNAWDRPAETVAPGAFIPSDHPMHKRPGTMPERLRDLDYLGLYKYLDVGLPVHGYGCFYKTVLEGAAQRRVQEGPRTTEIWETPKGRLTRVRERAVDNSSCTTKYPLENKADLEAMLYTIRATRYEADFSQAQRLLDQVGDQGYVNMIINRSPFGKLMIDLMGLENLAYMLFDDEGAIRELLETIEQRDRALWDLAARAPGRFVFVADNIDEFLYSPPWFERYCLPYYRKISDIAHAAGKKVLAHMDGRLRNLFPFVPATGFDLIDGSTPFPMNDYEPTELARALGPGQYAYCGVPANFVVERSPEACADFARRILQEGQGRFVMNIGDYLPVQAPIEVIEGIREVL